MFILSNNGSRLNNGVNNLDTESEQVIVFMDFIIVSLMLGRAINFNDFRDLIFEQEIYFVLWLQ